MSANLAQVEPWAPLPRQTDGALAPRVASSAHPMPASVPVLLRPRL